VPLSLIPVAKKVPLRGEIPIRVLVVDDEPLIRWSICAALAAANFDAVAAPTPDAARRMAAEWPPPRVIILDVQPDGQGRELMTDLRAIYPECRFVLMSTARRGAQAAPLNDRVQTIEKPFDLGELVKLVDRATQGAGGVS